MFSMDVSGTRRPPSNQKGKKPLDPPITRSFLSDVERGRVSVEQVQEMTRKRLPTPNPNASISSTATASVGGRPPRAGTPSSFSGPHRHHNDSTRTTTATVAGASPSSAATGNQTIDVSAVRAQSPAHDDYAFTSFTEICERTKDGVQPSWLVAKGLAEVAKHEQSARHENRKQFLHRVNKSVGTAEAIEIARMVAHQEAFSKRDADRSSVEHQVYRFSELELKAREGLVSREERQVLLDVARGRSADAPMTTPPNEEDVIDRTLQRHRMRSLADKPFRHVEPQHMAKMASQKILKEEELKSFGDELSLLASKSDTARLIGSRNKDARKTLMNQLMSWAQSVMARGDLSDMLEDFIKDAKRTKDGSILLEDIHNMMTGSGLMLTKQERQEFDDAVDPRSRGCVIPDRLRQVWRSHDAVRKVKSMDQDDAEAMFDTVRQENPGPITATFLSNWLRRTGAPIDADACHTIVSRLPRPLTKEVLFSEHVFQFLQDVWLDARAATRDVMSDAGMVDRARQLEALGAESNDTLEDVERASRTIHNSSQRMQTMHGQLQETLEVTAKLARRIPKTYTRAAATNTDVSVFGEMVMLWEGFLVQRDLELLDDAQDEKLTTILAKQNKAKSEEIVRLRTDFENVSSKMRQQVVLLSQQLDASQLNVVTLRSQVEQLTVGPGGELDFEDQSSMLDAHKREVNELVKQMNTKLSALRAEGQSKVRDLIAEVAEHKLRADEAERQLLAELENNRQAEARWASKVEALEEDVRGREDTVNNTEQMVSDYEQKYLLQEKRFVELDATLLAAREEIKKLTEQIEIHHSCEDSLVPAAELTRQVEAVRDALTTELQTERSAKEQFAQQLQATKSDLQRVEFSFLDKCGSLEQKLHSMSCERDTTEGALMTMLPRVLDLLEAVCVHVGSERDALAQCTDSVAVHATWVAASHATVDRIATLVDGMHKLVEGMPIDAAQGSAAEVDALLRRLQQERLREFPPPHNKVLDALTATRAELDAATTQMADNAEELRNAVAFADSHALSTQRLFAQVAEYATDVCDCCARGVAADAPLDTFLSLDGIPKALRTAVHDACSTIRKHISGAVALAADRATQLTAENMAQEEHLRLQRSGAAGPQRVPRDATDGAKGESTIVVNVCGNGAGALSMPLASVVATLRENTRRLRAAAANITDAIVQPLLRATEDLPWVTRDDVGALAAHKQQWRAARRAWLRHLWWYAIRTTVHAGRQQRAAASSPHDGREAATSAVGSLLAVWNTRWLNVAGCVLETVVEATAALGAVAHAMVMTSHVAAVEAAANEAGKEGTPAEAQPMRRGSSTTAGGHHNDGPASVRLRSSTSSVKRAPSIAASAIQSRAPSSVGRKGSSSRLSSIATPLTSVASSPVRGSPDALGFPISESVASSKSHQDMPTRRSTAGNAVMLLHENPEDGPRDLEHDEDELVHNGGSVCSSSRSSAVGVGGGAMDASATSSSRDNHHDEENAFGDSVLLPMFQAMPSCDSDVVAVDKDGNGSHRPSTRGGDSRRTLRREHGGSQSHSLRSLHGTDVVVVEAADAGQRHPCCLHCGGALMDHRGMRRSTSEAPTHSVGCQADLLRPSRDTAPPPVAQRPMVSAAVVTDRPSSSNQGSQTPPLPLIGSHRHSDGSDGAAAANHTHGPITRSSDDRVHALQDALDTPTSSECAWPAVTAQQRRVDSAQRRAMVPRPQSSDRPRSAIRLDEESVEALRPPTPQETSLGAPAAEHEPRRNNNSVAHRAKDTTGLTYNSVLSLHEMQQHVQAMRQGALRYVDIEFPHGAEDGSTPPSALELDCALSYLFDNLAPHCRVAAGKYCLLALFGGISEAMFAEYVFSHHYLPNRNVFVAPQEAELRWCFDALKRVGNILMRLRRPRDYGEALAAARSPVPARHPTTVRDASAGVLRSSSPPADHAMGRATTALSRPYSANSFPAAVVVLPLDDIAPTGAVHPTTAAGPDADGAIPPHATAPRVLSQAKRWEGPSGPFEVHGAGVRPAAVDTAEGDGTTGCWDAGDGVNEVGAEVVVPTGVRPAAPVVVLPVQERRQLTPQTSALPLDRSKPAIDDTLQVYTKVLQHRDGLAACGAALDDVAATLRTGGDGGAPPALKGSLVPQNKGSSGGGDGRPPSRGPTPTAMELLPHRSASATLTDATRQRLLPRPVRKLPPVAADTHPSTSPPPGAVLVKGGVGAGAVDQVSQREQDAQHSTPLTTQRLLPIGRPPPPGPTIAAVPRATSGVPSVGATDARSVSRGNDDGVVEMPVAVMRRR